MLAALKLLLLVPSLKGWSLFSKEKKKKATVSRSLGHTATATGFQSVTTNLLFSEIDFKKENY
jgi:hypothetical protein